MTKLAVLPRTAPFAEQDIAALDRVIRDASAPQRAWLSGFLAGLDASESTVAAPASPPAAAPTLTILYLTESGNSERLAENARAAARKRGFKVQMLDAADATPEALIGSSAVFVIAATWGEGEPPQRATAFYQAVMADSAPTLEGIDFAVLALGDSAYAQFCEVGKRLDARLAELRAHRLAERLDCDLDYEASAKSFIGDILSRLIAKHDNGSVIHVDFHRLSGDTAGTALDRPPPFPAEITAHHPLTSSRSTAETIHVEIDLTGSGIRYEPGDSLTITPRNDPAMVEGVLRAVGLDHDDDAARALTIERDITTLSSKLVTDYAALTDDPALIALSIDETERHAFVQGRQLIDLLERFPQKLQASQLTTLLRKLPPRHYSISSSQQLVGDAAHLTIATLEYESAGRTRLGVASSDIARRRRPGDVLDVFLRPNTSFRLPEDPAVPIIMIGAGTGIAPYRAFLQHREAGGQCGAAWLIFGHRHFLHDFLYQLEIQEWLKSGVLTDLDLAFSRDQPERRYVQHVLRQSADKLNAMIADGAIIYLCGNAGAMARDVEATLSEIIGADELRTLNSTRRYRKDVY